MFLNPLIFRVMLCSGNSKDALLRIDDISKHPPTERHVNEVFPLAEVITSCETTYLTEGNCFILVPVSKLELHSTDNSVSFTRILSGTCTSINPEPSKGSLNYKFIVIIVFALILVSLMVIEVIVYRLG
jgi:hypothetical protein